MAQTSSPNTKLSPSAQVGIGVVAVGLIAAAYFFLFFSDVSSQMTAQKKQETILQGDLMKERESEALYLADVAELAEKKRRQQEIQKILPEHAEVPSFLSAVQSVANASGVSLNSWEPLDEAPSQFFSRVPMKLTLSGHYHQIAKFFYGMSQLERIVNLENIVITLLRKENDEVFVKTECLATAFRSVIAPAASGSAGAPLDSAAPPAGAPPAAPGAH